MANRVALFGGSFDPIHLGHLWVAQHALEHLGVDQVVFLPAATSPLKPNGPVASQADRLAMLQLALSKVVDADGTRPMTIDDREMHRGGVSYTVDTVEEIKRERGEVELFLLLGSDVLADFRRWHLPQKLLGLVTPAVYRRGGTAEIDWTVLEGLASQERIAEIRQSSLLIPMIELSSSDIRARIAAGRGIRFMVPEEVRRYIIDRSLYSRKITELGG
ncbi:MAG: Nicotinate-nucleotide adenylyltransferase [Planctomycetota bacterium]|jgi:nicotinate-nucleotide adenylyltransferase